MAQLSLVLTKWPTELLKYCPSQVLAGAKVPLFNGPRVAMAIHTTGTFTTNMISGILPEDGEPCEITGNGIDFAWNLVDVCDGGQVVLSEPTWQKTKNIIPSSSRVISLGRCRITSSQTTHMLLIELAPSTLVKRTFKRLQVLDRSENGFEDAPDIIDPLAVVFLSVHKPSEVTRVERELGSDKSNASLDHMPPEILNTYSKSLEILVHHVRRSLIIFGGYESKQLSPGRFLIVFQNLKDAILWACYLQAELLEADWPPELLKLDECSVKENEKTHRVIRRGLEIKVGMAYGKVALREPTRVGRADYFGGVPSLAARVHGVASPGQILVQPGKSFVNCPIKWAKDHEFGILPFPKFEDVPMSELAVEIVYMGTFLPTGLSDVSNVYQVFFLFDKGPTFYASL